jgi:hypothetical protein
MHEVFAALGAFGLLGLLGYWVLGLFVNAALLALLPITSSFALTAITNLEPSLKLQQ